MVNRSQPKCFIQNIHDVVPSIPADDACQAEGQQLISQLPGHDGLDPQTVNCTCAMSASEGCQGCRVRNQKCILQWKHFCVGVSTGSYRRPSMPVENDDDVCPHRKISTHLMSTCYNTMFA